MKFHAYQIGEQPIDIEPAPFEREWMNATHDRFAYRCLPLNIANAHGWEVLSPAGFSAIWHGGPAIEDVKITVDAEGAGAASSLTSWKAGFSQVASLIAPWALKACRTATAP